jgi:hypothetical protein
MLEVDGSKVSAIAIHFCGTQFGHLALPRPGKSGFQVKAGAKRVARTLSTATPSSARTKAFSAL